MVCVGGGGGGGVWGRVRSLNKLEGFYPRICNFNLPPLPLQLGFLLKKVLLINKAEKGLQL